MCRKAVNQSINQNLALIGSVISALEMRNYALSHRNNNWSLPLQPSDWCIQQRLFTLFNVTFVYIADNLAYRWIPYIKYFSHCWYYKLFDVVHSWYSHIFYLCRQSALCWTDAWKAPPWWFCPRSVLWSNWQFVSRSGLCKLFCQSVRRYPATHMRYLLKCCVILSYCIATNQCVVELLLAF